MKSFAGLFDSIFHIFQFCISLQTFIYKYYTILQEPFVILEICKMGTQIYIRIEQLNFFAFSRP